MRFDQIGHENRFYERLAQKFTVFNTWLRLYELGRKWHDHHHPDPYGITDG